MFHLRTAVVFWTVSYLCSSIAKAQDCPTPPAADPNGGVTYPNTMAGAVATYTCNVGYDLGADETLVCLVDGTWDPMTAPPCDPVDCAPVPTADTNGDVDAPDTTFMSMITYTCDPGYIAVGSTTLTCLVGGKGKGKGKGVWSPTTAPTCAGVDCGSPPAADPNGALTTAPAATTVGSMATYMCNMGYDDVGGTTATCQDDGTWTDAPTCTPVDCGTPPTADPNGAVSAPVTTLGSVATYTCSSGYTPQGSTMLTCQADGTWDPTTAPTCVLVDCGPPPAADTNGAVVTPNPGTTFGSTVTYMCNVGYALLGGATLTCQADGTWGSAPLCLVDCGSPPAADPNGEVLAPTTTIGTVATYTCNAGYNINVAVGSMTLQCQADGTWDGTAPTCDPVDCGPAPAADPNGAASAPTPDTTLGSTVTYTCNSGYTPATTTLTCQADGTWGSVPTCVPVDCGVPPAADPNGAVSAPAITTVGSVATYTCNSGYNPSGSTTLTCQADGTWGSAPTCVIVDCDAPPAADSNGAVDAPVTTFGAVATYTCDDDFDLVGSTTLTCQADGTWDGTAPTCDPIPEEESSGKSNGKSNGKSKKKGKGRKRRALRTGMKRWALGGRE